MDTDLQDPHNRRPAEVRLSRKELYAEIAKRHEREDVADRRARRRFWVRTACWCWLWAILGLVLGAWAFRVNDVELGKIFLFSGQIVTLAGVLGTLGHAAVQAEKRGWR